MSDLLAAYYVFHINDKEISYSVYEGTVRVRDTGVLTLAEYDALVAAVRERLQE